MIRARFAVTAIGATVALAACAPAATGARTQDVGVPDANAMSRATEELLRQEDAALHLLAAADRRIAIRAGVVPTADDKRKAGVGAALSEEPTTFIIDGMPDTLSFDARKRALDEAEHIVASTADPDSERTLFSRLVAEERARLARERNLPQSASDIVRAIVETWTPPASPDIAAGRDQWLAKRLDDLRSSVTTTPMTNAERDELEDALDPLEKLAFGLGGSMKSLTALRLALGDVKLAPGHAPDPGPFFGEIRTFFGANYTQRSLLDTLAPLEASLRASVGGQLSALPRAQADQLGKAVASLLTKGTCAERTVPRSAMRSMRPPPERAAACPALEALCSANDATDVSLAALVALHEWVVLGMWAAQGASVGPRLLATYDSDVKSDLTRLAFVRPLVAIGGALYAREASIPEGQVSRERACEVIAQGNVPLDMLWMKVRPSGRR